MTQRYLARRAVLDSPGGLVVEPALLEVDGDRFSSVSTLEVHSEPWRAALAAGAEDLGVGLVTPAFVNAHTHLALSFLRGVRPPPGGRLVEDLFFHFESRLCAEDVRAFALVGAYESLLQGVGLVWDHYYFGDAVADAAAEAGLTAVVAPTLQDLGGPGKGAWTESLALTETLASEAGRRGVFAALGPHAPDTVSTELLTRALAVAEARSLPLHMHVAQSTSELAVIAEREGCTPFAWLARTGALTSSAPLLLAHGVFAPLDELRSLEPSRHALAFCPYSQALFAFPARVDLWTAEDIPWVAASDCAASNDGMGVTKELRFAAAMRSLGASFAPGYERWLRGVPSTEGSTDGPSHAWERRQERFETLGRLGDAAWLLDRVWSHPGRMHPGFRAGVLETGALASFLVWDDQGDPRLWPGSDPLRGLVFAEASGAIRRMVVRGRPIVGGGVPADALREDWSRATRAATARLEALLRG